MSAEDQTEPAAPETTEATPVAEEQQTDAQSYGETLLKLAADEGHDIGLKPKAEEEPEPDTLEEVPATELPEEEKPEEAEPVEEEEKPEEDKPVWPQSAKARVAEETAKKNRALERAEKAETAAAELQAELQKSLALPVTEDNPFNDIHNVNDLDRLEISYEKAVELADENPGEFGASDVLVGRDKNGEEIRKDFSQEQLSQMKRKAEKALRRQIPERRTYLQQRAQADAQAMDLYPDLKDPNSEFSQQTALLIYQVLSGRGMKAPDVAIWAARAIKGYRDELSRNGKTDTVKSAEGKKILQAAKQQIAPTTTRTRSIPERRGTVTLEKAGKELEEKGTPEAAEKYVAALFSQKGSSKRLEPMQE